MTRPDRVSPATAYQERERQHIAKQIAERSTMSAAEYDEDWGEMAYIPQSDSAAAGILEEE